MACTGTASQSVRKEVIDVLEMAGCVQVTTSPDLRPTVRLGLSSNTVLDGLPIVAPKNVVTALIYRLVLLFLKVSLRPLSKASPGVRSLRTFSRDLILVIHLEQTNDDKCWSCLTGTSKNRNSSWPSLL